MLESLSALFFERCCARRRARERGGTPLELPGEDTHRDGAWTRSRDGCATCPDSSDRPNQTRSLRALL